MNRVSEPDLLDALLHGGHRRRVAGALTKNTLALVLAGGRGSRLEELTNWRAKPSLPFGGKFRIIDFALSNCVNSGIRRIGICTQYKAQSLIRHVQRGWSFLDGRFDEFVELLPAQQRVEPTWYQGTADAVYQNLDILRRHDPDHVLILAGDHVYKMDYGRDARGPRRRGRADDHRLHRRAAGRRALARRDGRRRRAPRRGDSRRNRRSRHRCRAGRTARLPAWASTCSTPRSCTTSCCATPTTDAPATISGRTSFPASWSQGARVHAHHFADSCVNVTEDGIPYWRDVGTIDAYWEANIALTHVVPELNLYDEDWPIWTYQEQLPPAKFVFDDDDRRGTAIDSIVAGGCIISGSTVRRSSLFSERARPRLLHDRGLGGPAQGRRRPRHGAQESGRRQALPAAGTGLTVGLDPAEDRRRFRVTERGVTLIIPEMLGQQVHHLR